VRWTEQTAGVRRLWIGQYVLNHQRRLRFDFQSATLIDLQYSPRARWQFHLFLIFLLRFFIKEKMMKWSDLWESRIWNRIDHWYRITNSGRKRYCKLRNEFANTALRDGKKELCQPGTLNEQSADGRRAENCATKIFYRFSNKSIG